MDVSGDLGPTYRVSIVPRFVVSRVMTEYGQTICFDVRIFVLYTQTHTDVLSTPEPKPSKTLELQHSQKEPEHPNKPQKPPGNLPAPNPTWRIGALRK